MSSRSRAYFTSAPKRGVFTSSYTAVAFLGFAWLPTPVPIPPLGTLSVLPSLVLLPPVSIPPDRGSGVYQLLIPPDPSLVGTVLYLQGLIVNDANPDDVHLTGYTADVILN